MGAVNAFIRESASLGRPGYAETFAKAPFDFLTDTFRQKKTTLLDVIRHPQRLMEAMEAIIPLEIEMVRNGLDNSDNPLVFMPLHTGSDPFLSPEQFERFYWAPLKRVLMGIIEAGGVPLAFAEGSYQTRMDYFLDLPKGSMVWMIDRTDMAKLKRKVGHHACLVGNVPAYMFLSDDQGPIRAYCRKLIDEVGPGGGFMLSSGTALDEAKGAMLRAMIETAMEYGRY
jgi:uroporphyrinogen-III decarboxylase